MALADVIRSSTQQMEKSLDHLRTEFRTVRTGRASPGLVEHLRVDVSAYGSSMGLKELASIAVAEGNVIVIKPFDPSTLKDIQKAVEKSDININPQNDGKVLRLPVPALSTERRKLLVEQVKKLAEAQKVVVRNVRRDANKLFETEKKNKTMTEDDAKRGEEQTQKLTDEYCTKIDKLVTEKSKEIMEG